MQGVPGIAVVGAGISGLTTAALLQLSLGSVVLYPGATPVLATSPHDPDPRFATWHAAASVLPHSVRSASTVAWTATSQRYFSVLAFLARCGVRTQTHYELFENAPLQPPAYASVVRDFKVLDAQATSATGLSRASSAFPASGWRFAAYFCESAAYRRYLVELFQAAGGVIADAEDRGLGQHVDAGHRFVVNCTGLAAGKFLRNAEALDAPGDGFEPVRDPWAERPRIIRGHYLRAAIDAALTDARGAIVSYNYTPAPDVYPTASGATADVYCYPRASTWLLGGSRQTYEGPVPGAGEWPGEETATAVRTFAGSPVPVPAPVFDLNAELIAGLTQGRVDLQHLLRTRPECLVPGVGYRFERSHPHESVRLDTSRIRQNGTEAFVVHNYGHGGAGFTLSWGCAVAVRDALRDLGAEPGKVRVAPAYERDVALLSALSS